MRSNMDPEACAWLRLVGEVDQMLAEVVSMREHVGEILAEAASLRSELQALEAGEPADGDTIDAPAPPEAEV